MAARGEPATPPRAKRGRPRDANVDESVLKVTLAELADVGYQGMSIDGIAARAGFSKPTIYRRWPNKPSLAISAIAELVAAEPPELTGDLLTDVVSQLQAVHDNLERSGSVPLLGTLLAESDRHPQFIETYRERLMRPRRARLRKLLEAARDRGEIDADADIDAATLLLVSINLGKYMAGEGPAPGWLTPMVKLVLDAMAPPPAKPKPKPRKAPARRA
jgi:AcrR family transcriptional regulator